MVKRNIICRSRWLEEDKMQNADYASVQKEIEFYQEIGRRGLLALLPAAVKVVEGSLARRDARVARSLVRLLPGNRYVVLSAGVTLLEIGREKLVHIARLILLLERMRKRRHSGRSQPTGRASKARRVRK